jgi:hypothetical protein
LLEIEQSSIGQNMFSPSMLLRSGGFFFFAKSAAVDVYVAPTWKVPFGIK